MAKYGKKGPKTGSRIIKQPAEEPMSLARRVSWWSLLAMVFLVPIAMGNLTFLGFHMPMTYDQFDIVKVFLQRVFGLIALAAWGWDMLVRGGKIRRTPVDWLILAFLAWVTISALFSISPATAFFGKYRRFEGLLSFINYAVIYFLILQYADRPSRVRKLAQTLFWSGLVVAGYGVAQSLGHDIIQWGTLPFEVNRAFSTYGNPDLLGGFLMFSLPVTLGLVLSEERMIWRLIYWVGFAINVWCWIVAFTRGAWIGGLVSIPLVAIIAWRHSAKMRGVDWVPVGAIGAIAAVVIGKSLQSTNPVMNFMVRFKSIAEVGSGSGQTRTEIWQAAIAAIKARPIFGFGADTFRLVFPRYKPVTYVRDAGYRSVADNVHDYPLQLAAGIGIVGFLLMYGIFVWAAIRSAPLVFKRSDDRRRIMFGAFWAACAGYLVQLMFGLSVTGNTFLLWTAMGIVLAPTATSFEFKPPQWGVAAALVGMVLAGLGIGYQVVYMQADYDYLVAMVASQGQPRVDATLAAVRLNPYNDMYRAEVGLAYRDMMLQHLNEAQQAQTAGQSPAAGLQAAAASYAQSVASLEDTIKFVPWEYDNYVFLASLHNLAGQALDPKYYAAAKQVAQDGMAVEPFGPAILVEYARANQATGDLPTATDAAGRAAQMDPGFSDAWVLWSNLLNQGGNKAQAIDVLKQFLARTPPGTAPDASVSQSLSQLEAAPTKTAP
jgi:O-antigen ligase